MLVRNIVIVVQGMFILIFVVFSVFFKVGDKRITDNIANHPELDIKPFCSEQSCVSMWKDDVNKRLFFWANREAKEYEGYDQYISYKNRDAIDFTKPLTLSGCVVYQELL